MILRLRTLAAELTDVAVGAAATTTATDAPDAIDADAGDAQVMKLSDRGIHVLTVRDRHHPHAKGDTALHGLEDVRPRPTVAAATGDGIVLGGVRRVVRGGQAYPGQLDVSHRPG
jgi:hypothetical protein